MAWAWLLGIQPDSLKQGNKSHQLRRLRLYSFIVRTPHSHRYEDTFAVLRTGSFFTRTDAQLLRPSLSHHIVAPPDTPVGVPSFLPLNRALDHEREEACRVA